MSSLRQRDARPRLLVLNQYYWPGLEATAYLLSQLCAALAEDYDVTVITGRLAIPRADPGKTARDGVEIVRVRSTAFDRSRLFRRGLNYVTYLLASLRAGLFSARPDVVVCMTDPPVIGNVALIVARRFRAPLVVVSQDVFPEIAVELKRLEDEERERGRDRDAELALVKEDLERLQKQCLRLEQQNVEQQNVELLNRIEKARRVLEGRS